MEPESSFRNSIGTVDTTGKAHLGIPKKAQRTLLSLSKVCKLLTIKYLFHFSFPKDRWKSVSFIQYLRTPI